MSNTLAHMTASLIEKLTFALKLTGSKEAAIEHVKGESCAGPAAWDAAKKALNW
jgi:hypothetical protein